MKVIGLLGQSDCASAAKGSNTPATRVMANRIISSSLKLSCPSSTPATPSTLYSRSNEERQGDFPGHRLEAQAHALADPDVGLGDAAQRRVDAHTGIHVDQCHDIGRRRLEEEIERMMANRPGVDDAAGRRFLEGA